MIERCGSLIRIQLARARVSAQRRGLTEGLKILQRVASTTSLTSTEKLAVYLTMCELHYLDASPSDGILLFDTSIAPHLEDLDPDTALTIADDRTLLSQASFDFSHDNSSHLADQRRLVAVDIFDYRLLARAKESAETGEHLESIQCYWQLLQRAYRACSWRQGQIAEGGLAREYLAVNRISNAAYHAVLAQDDAILEAVANCIQSCKRREVVRDAIEGILGSTGLLRHSIATGILLSKIADVIPDGQLPQVAVWLYDRSAYSPKHWFDGRCVEAIWTAIAAIGHRLTAADADRFASAAVEHGEFRIASIHRRFILHALNACVGSATVEKLASIVPRLLDAATNLMADIDYIDAINVLIRVGKRCGAKTKEQIRARLYSTSKSDLNTVLVQAARHFDWEPSDPAAFERAVPRVIEKLRQQVEHLPPGQQPASLGGAAQLCIPGDGQNVVVHLYGAIHELEALVAHTDRLSDNAIRDLAATILDMSAHQENLVANKVTLLHHLSRLLHRLPGAFLEQASKTTMVIASSHVADHQGSADGRMGAMQARHQYGDPAELRGMAILCLARIHRSHPELVAEFDEMLSLAMADPNARVRALSFMVAREMSQLSMPQQVAAMLASADADPEAAATALSVFAVADHLEIDPTLWHVMLRCLETAQRSDHAAVRRAAASVAKLALGVPKASDSLTRLQRLSEQFAVDLSHAVRAAIERKVPDTGPIT